jgi:hypothetical protein
MGEMARHGAVNQNGAFTTKMRLELHESDRKTGRWRRHQRERAIKRAREGEINNGARCIKKLRVAGGKHGKSQEGEASRHECSYTTHRSM